MDGKILRPSADAAQRENTGDSLRAFKAGKAKRRVDPGSGRERRKKIARADLRRAGPDGLRRRGA